MIKPATARNSMRKGQNYDKRSPNKKPVVSFAARSNGPSGTITPDLESDTMTESEDERTTT